MLDLLKETSLLGCKPSSSPIDPNHRLKDDQDGRLINASRYQHLVGNIIYLSLTRFDIACAINVIS